MHYACMINITIRDVPHEVRDELAARAARSGRSLQEYLKAQLTELSARPDPAELVARIRRRRAHATTHVSVSEILAERDADRR